jgi:hypothetical protein
VVYTYMFVCVYIYYCVLFFVLSFLFLFSSALIPMAGVTLCVYWSVSQQRPVEITLWAVLIYFFCKLFFVVRCCRYLLFFLILYT